MSTLLRFAIKNTRKHLEAGVKSLPVEPQNPDIAAALEILADAPCENGIPEGIDETPSALDYPSVSVADTPWARFDTALVNSLAEAPWKAVFLWSTSVSPFSGGQNFSVTDEGAGWHGAPRVRCVTAEWADSQGTPFSAEWDLDTLNIEQRAEIYAAIVTNVLFGFNTAEILNWARQSFQAITGKKCPEPQRVVDLSLIAREIRPSIPMELQVKSKDDPRLKSLVSNGGSGWSFDGIVAITTGHLPEERHYDSPRQWCAPAPLTVSYHAQASGTARSLRSAFTELLRVSPSSDLLDAWDGYVASLEKNDMDRLHATQHFPQVLNHMHMTGMPFSNEYYERLRGELKDTVLRCVETLLEKAPALTEFEGDLKDIERGYSENLKKAIGSTFEELGLQLEYTKGHPRLPKIGEKELRGAGATQNESAAPLFDALVELGKAKRRFEMARNLAEFAKNSPDGRIHSIFSAATGTLRLTSVEPNAQQMPALQSFRDVVEAPEGYSVVAWDFKAIDVRVGAALAIRAQRIWVKALTTGNLELLTKDRSMIEALDTALRDPNPQAKYVELDQALKNIRQRAKSSNKWGEYESTCKRLIAYKAAAAWLKIVPKTKGSPDQCWSGLREAFRLDADVHTYTAMRLAGANPAEMIRTELGENADKSARKQWWERQTNIIGPARKRGKIGNLSLLYGMTLLGFREDAAKKFDEHWSLEEAGEVYDGWFDAFPEIQLMHCITEMQAITHDSNGRRLFGYRLKDEGRGKIRPLNIYKCRTLSGRVLYAEGLNAGLNYGNQGTGADILMDAMVTLRINYRVQHDTMINQAHDELVGLIPDPHVQAYREIYETVLLESANRLTAEYGVPMEISSTVGKTWIKD